jgi:nucleoid-associated protein YgaU
MTAELRRSIFLACVGLLGGFALVVTLYGASALFKHGFGAAEDRTARLAAVPEAASGGEASGPPLSERPSSNPAVPSGLENGPAAAPPKSSVQASAPTFDIIRVEPSGEAVIAGRAAPNTTVELLRDGEAVARALVDPSGQYAVVPPALPSGSSEITLRATGADGRTLPSRESVAVVVAPGRDAKPLVALTSPDKPTVVLSQPASQDPPPQPVAKLEENPRSDAAPREAQAAPAKPAEAAPAPGSAGTVPVKIVSVEAEEGGRLYVTGAAQPGATVRLYLNDTAVAPGSVGADGRFAFTIGRGVQPGAYAIRVDEVDPVSGRVKTRSEVPFTVPAKPEVAKPAPKVALLPPPAAETPAPRVEIPKLPQALVVPPPRPAVEPSPPVQASMAAEPEADPALKAAPKPEPQAAPKPDLQLAAKPEPKADPAPRPEGPPAVFVPEIGTARIVRGDSLWQISRRTYGRGTRYTVIYDANQPQIRNPDRIFPGQIFVLPNDGTAAVTGAEKRG